MRSNAVLVAIDAGHETGWERVTDGTKAYDTATTCKLDGEPWPCKAIREARETVRQAYKGITPWANA